MNSARLLNEQYRRSDGFLPGSNLVDEYVIDCERASRDRAGGDRSEGGDGTASSAWRRLLAT